MAWQGVRWDCSPPARLPIDVFAFRLPAAQRHAMRCRAQKVFMPCVIRQREFAAAVRTSAAARSTYAQGSARHCCAFRWNAKRLGVRDVAAVVCTPEVFPSLPFSLLIYMALHCFCLHDYFHYLHTLFSICFFLLSFSSAGPPPYAHAFTPSLFAPCNLCAPSARRPRARRPAFRGQCIYEVTSPPPLPTAPLEDFASTRGADAQHARRLPAPPARAGGAVFRHMLLPPAAFSVDDSAPPACRW